MNHIPCSDPNCLSVIAMTDKQLAHYKETGAGFKCPAGHGNAFKTTELSKLREKVARLEAQLKRVARDKDYYCRRARERWRCPFGGCGYEVDSQGSMVRHIKTKHLAPLQLPPDSGPNALNSKVY